MADTIHTKVTAENTETPASRPKARQPKPTTAPAGTVAARKPVKKPSSAKAAVSRASATVSVKQSASARSPKSIMKTPEPASAPVPVVVTPEETVTFTPEADQEAFTPESQPLSDVSAYQAPVPDGAFTSGPAESARAVASGLTDDEVKPDAAADEAIDFEELRTRLMALQQQIRHAGIPVVLVFEGWDASGKATMLSKLIEGLDPRGYQVYPIRKPSEEERHYPTMYRYWTKMPAQGNISLFCSSWYREVSNACYENKLTRKRLNQAFDEIVSMESQLACNGTLVIKFFFHISCKEQKRRLKALESKKSTRWRVDKDDWVQNEHYSDFLRLFDAMITRTHYDGAQWHVLRSDGRRACVKQIYDIVIAEFLAALKEREEGKRIWDTPFLSHLESVRTLPFPQLETFDPEQALTDPYKPAVDKAQKRLRKLQNELYRRGIPMAIGFEGWDAAGKGGAIRRLTSALDARGFDVVPIAAPTPLEKSHHFLWRFWHALPKDGHIAIFDRTWYGRVMVERIEGYCTEAQWKRAYEEINRFEAELANHGMILCKFWMQIDRDTQLARFNDREIAPDKQWKITEEDWRNREKWPLYETAVNDMLQKTNTACAPWTLVEANNKQYARLKVLTTVIAAIEARLEECHG